MSNGTMLRLSHEEVLNLEARGLGKALLRAVNMAGGETIRAMRAEASRHVRQRKRLRAAAVRKTLVLRFPKTRSALETLEWRVDVSGKEIPLSAYPHRQIGKGVSVAVNRAKRKIIRGAFVATMKSGHYGIFIRVRAEGPQPKPKGRAKRNALPSRTPRLPIKELFSSRISDVMRDTGTIPRIQARGQEVFSAAVSRLLPLEIEKLKRP